ncbi:AraC family transcriptional regulator [Clostridium beijerinckii]|uniref:AraC-like DNA-binding protein n=1 Tax=Clostridium beijerinckii TaxID=1520 RepID=A0AAX0B7Z1_CLOBE|nr:AraC family transcriptional regulator [Clostridium beijerinckii]MBA8932431.1 AraC-like DNA-binding protein [Clostridium beijerinckii]NOW06617.1 AraC-like DNA-binding protein [Clostridium beijerinckii]NRT37599.1 AraC-like DNA-binding protein [Clostridium beijerinckii]NRT48658.1 AraC-like DNA-binding protein [Clostridium beijerinckii]NRT90693.1 AraC-like DNA-binding protein [Clostridium beijerinckii]
MHGSFEKTVLEPEFPFRLFFNDGYSNTPHHWHEDIEIIYLVEGTLKACINRDTYDLTQGDILIIGGGEIHCFFKEKKFSNRAVIQFRTSIYDNFLSGTKDTKIIKPMWNQSIHLTMGNEIHALMERHINEIINEYSKAEEGYKLIIKARLYDLAGILLRYIPKQAYSSEDLSREKERLKKMDSVFQYVDSNYQEHIDLDDISKSIGFSKYYFTKFFKENTGVTFLDYLNNYRIKKAEWRIIEEDETIAEIAYNCGFNSIKTFNRLFKNIAGCTPMKYRRDNKN